MLKVDIVYINSAQELLTNQCDMPENSTIGDVLKHLGWLDIYPEIKNLAFGIFITRSKARRRQKGRHPHKKSI